MTVRYLRSVWGVDGYDGLVLRKRSQSPQLQDWAGDHQELWGPLLTVRISKFHRHASLLSNLQCLHRDLE